MQSLRNICHLFYLGFTLLLLSACSDSDDSVSGEGFDRSQMLANIADNLIQPSFQALQADVNTLSVATADFQSEPNATNLDALQTAWKDAYMSWQHSSAFDFGPASRSLGTLGEIIATFPADAERIEAIINDPDFDLSNNFELDIRGFLAVEYLIFDLSGDEAVLTRYASEAEDRAERLDYLQTLVDNIKSEVDAVTSGWQSYRSTFVAADGTEVGSGTSLLYNGFVADYERLKNFKVGVPAGLRSGQSNSEPQLVEAFYSGESLTMMEEHLQAVENIWRGRSQNGTNGIGFEEYLMSVTGGPALIESTETQLSAALSSVEAIPEGRLSEIIQNNPTVVENAHTELQKLTRFFKSDMSSLLGISITFNSGDGD